MKRTVWVLTLLCVLTLAVLGGRPAGAQDEEGSTTGAPDTPDGDDAIDDLVGCIQSSGQLLVLVLIDESASLKGTDPDDVRVDAAQGALDSLVALATTGGEAAPDVQVALAAFSNEYREVQGWTPVDEASAPELRESLDLFRDFNQGIDTDFVNALSAAQTALADQVAATATDGRTQPCRAVLLFTDGGFDIAVRESAEDQERLGLTKPYAPEIELTTKEQVEAAEAAGRAALCDEGGLADRLRGDEVTLLTVALSGEVARRSQYPLAAAAAGSADAYTCGTQDGTVTGAYLPADGIDVLLLRFSEVGTRLAGGNLVEGPGTVEICGESVCEEGTRTFTLDPTLRQAQVQMLGPEPGLEVELEGPSGESTRIDGAGTFTVGAAQAQARRTADRGLTIDIARPDDEESWTGEWSATVVDPSGDQAGGTAQIQVYVFSDIGVELTKSGPLNRGADATIEAALVLPEELPEGSAIATATAEARLKNAITGEVEVVAMEGPPEGPYAATYAAPADTTTNAVDLSVQVSVTTNGGVSLVAQSPVVEVLVRRAAGSIQFVPASLRFLPLTGAGTTDTILTVVPGEADGCVWFGEPTITDQPAGSGQIDFTIDGAALPSEADCIPVPVGEPVSLVLDASPSERASGTVRGHLVVMERTAEGEASTTQVPLSFDMAQGVDQARRLLLAAGLLVVGLALPLLALLIINMVTARFQTLDSVRGTSLAVSVRSGVVSRIEGGRRRPMSLTAGDFESLADLGNTRTFTFGGVVFRARAARNPFGSTQALAAPEGGAEKLKGGQGSRVELDPGLAGSWVFLLDADKTLRAGRGEEVGQLIAFVAEGDLTAQTTRMVPDINAGVPAIATRLAALIRDAEAKDRRDKKSAPAPKASAESEPEAEPEPEPEPEPADEPEPKDDPGPPAGFSGRPPSA